MGFLYDFLVGGRGIFQIYWRKFVNNSSNIIFIFLYLLKWFFNKKECLYVLLKFTKLRPFCRKMTEISYFSMPLTYLKKKKKKPRNPSYLILLSISCFWVSFCPIFLYRTVILYGNPIFLQICLWKEYQDSVFSVM